jgi:nucleoside-diphosphate-sugar epimerase
MSNTRRNLLLFGASGQIGEALRQCLRLSASSSLHDVHCCPWSEVAKIRRNDLASHFKELACSLIAERKELDIVFANGSTNPLSSPNELTFSNVLFPLTIIDATAGFIEIRYMTLGTVFEEFDEYASTNAYIRSKRDLSDALLKRGFLIDAQRVLHLRLHTIYGGPLKPFMFLGQLIYALEHLNEFCMTSGEQLREYHHVNDIAGAIVCLLQRTWCFDSPILELNSGAPVRLADLARTLFVESGRPDLLRVGALEGAPGDNRNRVFERSEPDILPYFRNPLLGVLDYVRARRHDLCPPKR